MDRPGVTGAVLQIASSLINYLINWLILCENIVKTPSLTNKQVLGTGNLERMFNTPYMSHVTCHMTHVKCQHFFYIVNKAFDINIEVFFFFSQCGGVSWWRAFIKGANLSSFLVQRNAGMSACPCHPLDLGWLAWHGMAWNGMAWHGMAWHGMAWHGTFHQDRQRNAP